MKKKILSLLLILVLVLQISPCFAASEKPELKSEAALLIDMTTGSVLYDKNSTQRMFPASMTKMLTCILALENLDMSEYITINGSDIANVGGTTLHLVDGEKINVGTMLSAMMVISANDAAVVLANKMAGSVEAFSQMMNEKAAEIGCTDSNFVNPNGLHNENHYSTCADMAKIANYCMQNETFQRIVSRSTFIVPETNKSPERQLASTNFLLDDESARNRVYVNGVLRFCKYDGCIGIKTGYTSEAGGCLAAAASKNGTTLLSVVMNSGDLDRFADSIMLFDWGFENFKTLRISDPGIDAGEIKVKGGKISKVAVEVPEIGYVTVPKEASSELLDTKLVIADSVTAPFAAGTVVGKLQILNGNEVVAEYDAVTVEGVERGGILSATGIADSTIKKVLLIILIVILVLILILTIYVLYKRKQMAKRKAARAARRAKLEEQEAQLRREWEKTYHNRYRNDL